MTDRDLEYMTEEHYSRRAKKGKHKRERKQGHKREKAPKEKEVLEFNEHFKEQLQPTRVWLALLCSFLLSVMSVANPLFTRFASNLQHQGLYAGMAMQAGQSPYGDFFATDGVLYYLITYVGSFFGTTIGLAILQFIALSIAGIYFYKLMAFFSRSQAVADQLSIWFYLFLMAFGFGGIYASMFALPFLLTSLWYLVRYFDNSVRDEAFILYGIDAALVFMIYPKAAVLWLVSALVLFIYNIRHHRFARGIYQVLAGIFGFLLIVYSVGYYTFIQQILGSAIRQTFLYNLQFSFDVERMLWPALITLIGLVVTGFLKNMVEMCLSLKNKSYGYMKVIVLVAFVVQLFFILANPHFELSQLVILLPYGFMMAVLDHKFLAPEFDTLNSTRLDDEESAEEIEFERGTEKRPFSYLKSSLFLPIIACVFIPIQPILSHVLEGDLVAERTEIARYIKENTKESDTIYAWDNSAQIYLQAERLSTANIITAQPYLTNEENQSQLAYDLNKNGAQYIVVNKKVELLDAVKKNIENNYTLVETKSDYLALYLKK